MNTPQYIPSFYFYKFAQEISEPFTSLQAYQAGAIDEHGNILKAESSIDPLEYLVIKLKKIFAELPSGMTKAKLNNYLSTLQLFGEEVQQIGITEGEYMGLVEGHIALYVNQNLSYIELCEDMAGGGMASAGTSPGYNTGSVSGFDPELVSGIQRRKPLLKGLDNCEMYDVCPEEMGHFKAAKAWKHVPNSETKTYLQRAQSRNAKKIAVRSVNPDTGEQDVHWINYPTKSFAEEYHLGFLDLLNEKNTGEVEKYKDSQDDNKKNVATARNSEETYSSSAKDLANIAVQNIVKPPKIDINPSTGKLKRGTRTQRSGFLFSAIADLTKGGKRHQDETADKLIPLASNEVSSSGEDSMSYDEKRGLWVPADLKGDNTTPFTHISDNQKNLFAGLPQLDATVQKMLKRNVKLTDNQKETIRQTTERIAKRSSEQLGKTFQQGILNISPDLNWVITPGSSTKPYNYPGLVTRVTPENIAKYAGSSAKPTLSPRPSEGRVEYKVRGREPTVAAVAKELSGPGSVSTSKTDILTAMEKMISPKLFRQMQRILAPNLRRAR